MQRRRSAPVPEDDPSSSALAAENAARDRAGIQSVEVGFALLEVLARATAPLMLRDLASAADMSAAKAHRYLVSFQRLGMVTQDPANARYALGPMALRLGLAALHQLDPVRLARERAAELAATLGHTVALAVWGNHGPTIVHWQESALARPVTLRLGDVMPLLGSATGQCFAAWLRPRARGAAARALDAMIDAELRRIRALPPDARGELPLTRAEVHALLQRVREQGMARVVGTLLPGVAGFCAPVFDADGRLALGMVALGPVPAFDAQWGGAAERALRAQAQALSAELGWPGAASDAARP